MRILLLNPPGDKNYSRDLFLGTVLEEGLCLPPQDLVCLSGWLSDRAELMVLDAIAEGLSESAARKRIAAFDPDVVIFQTSICSYLPDTRFMAGLPEARFIGVGDLYREIGEMAFLLHPFLDAVLLDFTTGDILDYLEGPEGKPVQNVIYKETRGGAPIKGARRHLYGDWPMPQPRWDLFPLEKYRWPFAGPGAAASVLGEFGCPFLCTYCPQSSLAYKARGLDSIQAEIRALAGLGARSVFLRDQTFAAHRGRAEAFMDAGLDISWAAQTRVDLVDEALLAKMKAAGCAAVCYGIDSGQDDILQAYKKNATRRQAERAVALTRRAGLKAWGVFLVGFPMDTKDSVEDTLAFSRALGLDHVSYRVETQRQAADYRRDMLVKGLVPPESMPPDTPTTTSVWQGKLAISNADVFEYQAGAHG